MRKQVQRRDFLKTTAVTGVGFWLCAGKAAKVSASPNERIAFGGIGIGGKGSSDINNAGKFADVVAVCDIDRNRLAGALKKFPNAKGYTDFRKMLEEQEKSLDAVTVSTPDHTHAPAALMAMRMKKHCYVQKPLTRTIYEARLMGKVAKEMGVCTQMGNQGSSERWLRDQAAQIRAGALGDVKEIHVWTNRPIWPQGFGIVTDLEKYAAKMKEEKPDEADKLVEEMKKRIATDLEKNVDWESWLGPAKYREYFPMRTYHDFNWRGFWDFGTGALGDIACHSLNKHMKALDLSTPRSVKAVTSGHDFDAFPSWSIIEYQYEANEWRKPFKFVWYDGGKMPSREFLADHGVKIGEKMPEGGDLIIGTKGNMWGGGYINCKPLPDVEVEYAPEHPEHNDGDSRNMYELCVAIKENKPERCFSNFPDQAGPLTEAMLLGNLAVWTAHEPEKEGEMIEWDAAKMEVTNLASIKTPKTAELVKPVYREGYRLD